MHGKIEDIITELARRYNLPRPVVENAVRYPFDFIHSEISSKQFNTILLHHLGKFTVKPGRLKQIQKWEDAKEAKRVDVESETEVSDVGTEATLETRDISQS